MKNKLLLGMFLFAGAGIASAQKVQTIRGFHTQQIGINEVPADKYPAYSEKALGEVVWYDNFDSIVSGPGLANTSTSDWTIDNDGQTSDFNGQTGTAAGWSINTTAERCFLAKPASFTGNYAELTNRTLACDDDSNGDWQGPVANVVYRMTSAPIDVQTLAGGNAIFSFEQQSVMFNDQQKVLISTNGVDWTLMRNNKDVHQINTPFAPNGQREIVEIDITPYISGNADNVQIRFEWTHATTGTGQNLWFAYGWMVDNLKISSKSDYDLVNTYGHWHVNGGQYTLVPEAQVAPMLFRAGVKNQGGESLTGVKLTLNITGPSGTSSVSSPAITLAAGAVDTLEVAYTPAGGIGTYTITRSLEMNEADDSPSNNNVQISTPVRVDVTDNIYAVDKQPFGTNYGSVNLAWSLSGTTVEFSNVGVFYDAFAAQELVGVDFKLHKAGTQENAEIMAFLNEYNPVSGKYDIERATTDFYTVTNLDDTDNIISVDFENPYTVQSGKNYILYLDLSMSSVPFAVASSGTSTVGQTAALMTNTEHQGLYLPLDDCAVIRARFKPSEVGIENEVVKVTEVSIFPNPATDKATVNFNTVNASDVSVQVIDITGKVIETVSLNNVAAGVNSTELNTAGFAAGIYSVVVTTNDSSVTKKLVIK